VGVLLLHEPDQRHDSESVTFIGGAAYSGCTNLTGAYFKVRPQPRFWVREFGFQVFAEAIVYYCQDSGLEFHICRSSNKAVESRGVDHRFSVPRAVEFNVGFTYHLG